MMLSTRSTASLRSWRRLVVIPAVVSLAALGLAACSSSTAKPAPATTSSSGASSSADSVAKLYAAAKTDGTLTWYTALDPTTAQNTVNAFNANYPGVTANFQRFTSGDLATRYSSEESAGSSPADVITVAAPPFLEAAEKQGWINTKPTLPDLASFPKAFYSAGEATVSVLPLGIGYNTNLVPKADVPKTWKDVLSSKFTGKILYGDPRSVPTYMSLAYLLKQKVSSSFLTDLAAQKFTVVASVVPGTQTLAAGGASLLFPETQQLAETLPGAPISIVIPSPTTGLVFKTVVTSHATHSSAAQLFEDFLLTPAGQAVVNANYGSSPLGNVGGNSIALPKGYVAPQDDAAAADQTTLLAELGIQ
jgi:ABC-type Fe3+ transport system substrate-binding protein